MTTIEYLQEHTLNPNFVKSLGWQWTEDAITIPYYDENATLLFCKYRNMSGDKFTFERGNSPALYATHKIKNQHVVVLCEGEADCAKLWQEGIPAVTPGGVTALSEQVALPLKDKEVIVLLDTDKPGQNAIEKDCEILLAIGATPLVATLPKNVKDVCEYFAQGNTKDSFQEILGAALYYEDWQLKNEPVEFSIVSGVDILTRELPEQAWLIDRMVPVEGFTFIVGSEGTGKSFDALTMAHSIVTGNSWLDTFPVKQKTNVLFIDKESTIRRIQNRMQGLTITGEGIFYLEFPQWFKLSSEQEDDFSDFAKKIKRFVGKNDIGLIIIDSFADVMLGNENTSADVQLFFDGFRQLLPGKSIIVLHHANKPSAGMVRTAAQKTRGSSNIMAQVYSAFYVEQIPKRNNEFSFEHIKAGDTEKIKKFKIEMEIHTDLYDKSKTKVIGLRFAGEIEEEEDKAIRAEELILSTLTTINEIPRKTLEEMCVVQNVSKRTVVTVLKKLREDSIIEIIADPHKKLQKLIRLI